MLDPTKSVLRIALTVAIVAIGAGRTNAQPDRELSEGATENSHTLYEHPPRWLVDVPTAGTLKRGYFDIGVRVYPGGGGIGFTNIGLSNRFMLGLSFGGDEVISNTNPHWNPRIDFSLKFRIIDESMYIPSISLGYSDQGSGAWNPDYRRYTFKSRGFYAVASRGFYAYTWAASWHGGVNYSTEGELDQDKSINFFAGMDATFDYNLGLLLEYDVALNDNNGKQRLTYDPPSGKGRGYLNMSVKWLFTKNLELEFIAKDLLTNSRESSTFTRELRMTYIENF
jgi:hypothetical protein